jgi:glutaredoxin-like protein NrdH
MVRVYGKEECIQCSWTKKRLEKHNIPYVYHDIEADEQARKVVEEVGRLQLPLVVARLDTKTQSWNGFSPDKIDALRFT